MMQLQPGKGRPLGSAGLALLREAGGGGTLLHEAPCLAHHSCQCVLQGGAQSPLVSQLLPSDPSHDLRERLLAVLRHL